MSSEDNFGTVEPQSESYSDAVLRYGIIGGLILVVYGLLGNIFGFARPSAGMGMILINFLITAAIYIGLMVMAVRQHREEDLGGTIGFGRAFTVAFLAGLLAGLIGAAFNFVYINYIDPDYAKTIIEESVRMYERMGLSEEQIDQALASMREGFEPGRFLMNSLLYTGIMSAIVAAIIGAIMKKSDVPAA
ncbi:MAG: DUF4199 domain-containing protein [Saprospiraceae bacterium]|nr:DUF4199 domain-containing protein [Saprospiraceae bacterium]